MIKVDHTYLASQNKQKKTISRLTAIFLLSAKFGLTDEPPPTPPPPQSGANILYVHKPLIISLHKKPPVIDVVGLDAASSHVSSWQ
jgi:hypothetical protein